MKASAGKDRAQSKTAARAPGEPAPPDPRNAPGRPGGPPLPRGEPAPPHPPKAPWSFRLFAAAFGVFLGLCLLKFGNPPIMEKWVTAPDNGFELVLGYPWPISWAYWLLGVLLVLGLRVALGGQGAIATSVSLPVLRGISRARLGVILLPLAWLGWQFVASSQSLNPALSGPTVAHFAACVACFYLGLLALSRVPQLSGFWLGLLAGFFLVLVVGWEQHFGGLKQSSWYFMEYVYPKTKDVPPEFLKKLNSTRIFSTLFYPNSLAGALLLLTPCILLAVWKLSRWRFTLGARLFLVALVAVGAAGCLFWSGSKGGWLLMLLLGLVATFHLRFPLRLKIVLILVLSAGGLAGFFWKYSGFFKKGATSVVARFDYWHAATRTALESPWHGTGPGTFAIPYQRLKRPESEMARLVHNDYLEQASDSGLPGFVFYTCFVLAGLVATYPRRSLFPGSAAGSMGAERSHVRSTSGQALADAFGSDYWQQLAVWLGVLGWALQGLVEFGLYLPALAWPAFVLLGWMLAPGLGTNLMDKPGFSK